jgi:hypothetical protein
MHDDIRCRDGRGGSWHSSPKVTRLLLQVRFLCVVLSVAAVVAAAWPMLCRQRGGAVAPVTPSPGPARTVGSLWQEPKWGIGDPAPDFTLPRADSSGPTRLRDLVGRKPVVLVFGSLSCTLFDRCRPALARLYQDNHARAEFLFVNIREAAQHVSGLEFLIPAGQREEWPEETVCRCSLEEHRRAVRKALARTGFPLPTVIDREDEEVMYQYGAFPMRLVVVDAGGRVALDLGRAVGLGREVEGWDLLAVDDWLRAHAVTPGAVDSSPG